MKILIVCNPEEGKATEVSLYLKCEADRMNRRVVVRNAGETGRTPERFDAVIILGELPGKNFSDPVQQYVASNISHLNNMPSFFLAVLECTDENNLQVPEAAKHLVRKFLAGESWNPQQVMVVPVGLRLQENQFVTLADWPELKIALQRFLIRNDLMMAS